ncbi:MAG: hypothetical protein EAY65_00975 [Alphaproteobacteria bacterium]|nr:MAG: hypothetical protein EAY65_00975 [Alphaproteobacteria bacterium]
MVTLNLSLRRVHMDITALRVGKQKLYLFVAIDRASKYVYAELYPTMTFLLYYNHQKKLKSLNFISPYDKIIQEFDQKPHLFHINPTHKLMGLNTYLTTRKS